MKIIITQLIDIKEKVRFYIESNFFLGTNSTINDNDSFLDNGIIDSTGVLEITGFILSEFNLYIEDKEMLPSNLDSINQIANFVNNKMSSK